jgi:hypothetical protein
MAAHIGRAVMGGAISVLVLSLAVGTEQAASSANLQCPRCPRGTDYAPSPGQFNFFFLVRQWPFQFCHRPNECSREPDE